MDQQCTGIFIYELAFHYINKYKMMYLYYPRLNINMKQFKSYLNSSKVSKEDFERLWSTKF